MRWIFFIVDSKIIFRLASYSDNCTINNEKEINMKKILATAAIVGIAATGLGAMTVSATNTNGQSLADAIANHFQLNADDVKKVVSEYRETKHAEHRAERTEKVNEKLDTLVSEGKITAEQSTAIKEKRTQIQQEREAEREKMRESGERPGRAEMRKKMETRRTEMKKWLASQGIDEQYGHMLGDKGHHKHRHHGAEKDQ